MKKSKQGFTLIELLVVIAVIGILATTLAPKLREQLAKGKDAKVIAGLGAGRTAINVISFEKMVKSDTEAQMMNLETGWIRKQGKYLKRMTVIYG